MKTKITNIVKYNRTVYAIYYYCMSFLINALKVFVKPDDKLILFNSFAGRKYDDSPKELFEQIKKDPRFSEYRLVWAFHDPEKFEVEGAEKIKTDGLQYFVTALKARVWITNSSVERGLNFKGKHTFYLNTWHGTPMKKMGSDISADNTSFTSKAKNKTDAMNAQGKFDADIFSRVFGIPRERFLEVGLPRNDRLVNYTEEERQAIRSRLDIAGDKKVILYAPTFREYEKDENMGCVLAPPMDLKKWESELSDRYVLLFRAHYEVAKVMEIEENEFVRNMTNYPSLDDLMIAADVLVSDYSSVFFDFSVMNKPMLHFTYDYDKYSALRGMYFDIREMLAGGSTEDEVIALLQDETQLAGLTGKTVAFRNRFVNYYGEAAEKTVEFLAKELNLD